MRWFITGGCGFIGSRLIKSLSKNIDNEIVIFDNYSVGEPKDLGDLEKSPKISIFEGDIRDETALVKASEGCDAIVHLAAVSGVRISIDEPRDVFDINCLGTFNVLEAARTNKVGRVIVASTGCAIGTAEPPMRENMVARPDSPYGASKLMGEAYCKCYSDSFGMNATALRFSNVYGPGAYKKISLVHKYIKVAIQGGSLFLYGDGTQTRDFLYVDDMVKAIEKVALEQNLSGETFNICTGIETAINDVIAALDSALAEQGIGKPEIIPEPRIEGELHRNYSSPDKLLNAIGWKASTDLKDGLPQTISYFKSVLS